MRQVTHALLTRPPLSHKIFISEENQIECFVRLACVKHAASVHPEPGSNSHVKKFCPARIKSGFQSETMSWFTVLRLLLYRSVLELFSKSFKVFHCSVINVRCCYFQQLVYFIISSSRCQQLFYFSLLSFFRGNSDILSCLSLFVNNFLNLFIWFKAEKEGFEPSRRC